MLSRLAARVRSTRTDTPGVTTVAWGFVVGGSFHQIPHQLFMAAGSNRGFIAVLSNGARLTVTDADGQFTAAVRRGRHGALHDLGSPAAERLLKAARTSTANQDGFAWLATRLDELKPVEVADPAALTILRAQPDASAKQAALAELAETIINAATLGEAVRRNLRAFIVGGVTGATAGGLVAYGTGEVQAISALAAISAPMAAAGQFGYAYERKWLSDQESNSGRMPGRPWLLADPNLRQRPFIDWFLQLSKVAKCQLIAATVALPVLAGKLSNGDIDPITGLAFQATMVILPSFIGRMAARWSYRRDWKKHDAESPKPPDPAR